MSLIAWFPLNGTLNNQGINGNITATNNGATINSAGKIGLCYSFTTSQNILINNLPYSSLTSCSICFWIKIGTSEDSWLPFTGQDGNYFLLASSNGTGNFYHGNAGSPSKIYRDGVEATAPLKDGNWHHYCVVGANLSSWTKFYINNYSSSWNFAGLVNDVRIYTLVLSPSEVKEISKGLVCHYTLGSESLTTGSNLITGLAGGGQCTISGSTVNISGTNSDTYFYIKTASALTEGKLYRLSCYGSGFPSGAYYNFPVGGLSNTSTGLIKVLNGYCELVFTCNSTIVNAGTNIIMDDTSKSAGAGTISNIDLREYTGVADSSGYCRNGTISGTLIPNSDTSRYKNCVRVTGTGKIVYPFPNLLQFTFSLWFKRDRVSLSNREMLGTGWYGLSMELNSDNTLTMRHLLTSGTWDVISTTKFSDTSKWYHIALTRNASGVSKIYVNGVEDKSGTNTDAINYTASTAELFTYSDSYLFRGSMSDFRIYATALSADDVKDLYNLGALIS